MRSLGICCATVGELTADARGIVVIGAAAAGGWHETGLRVCVVEDICDVQREQCVRRRMWYGDIERPAYEWCRRSGAGYRLAPTRGD